MKLNIGSWVIRMDGYLNLDICPDKEPDILASCLQTGLGDNSVEEIYCSHLIEHLDKNELKQFANESFRILQSGGKFYSVCPSFEGAISEYNKQLDINWLDCYLYANHTHAYDYHKQGIYKDKLFNIFNKFVNFDCYEQFSYCPEIVFICYK